MYFYTESFKSTYEWAYGGTGQGILQSEGLISFRDKVEKCFKFYFDLEPFLVDRAMIRPLFTSDFLDMENEPQETFDDLNVLDNDESDDDSMLQFNAKEKSVVSPSQNVENATMLIDGATHEATNVAMSSTSSIMPPSQHGQNETMQIEDAINDNANVAMSSISSASSNKKRKNHHHLLENQNHPNTMVTTTWNLSKIDYCT